MIVVRPGGILGLVIAATIAALFVYVVRPAIEATTDGAWDTATRALGPELSTEAALARIQHRLGAGTELVALTIHDQGGSVSYRTGDGAAGFQWGRGRDGLEPAEVTLVGPGSLKDNVFPIAKLDPAAPARLAARLKGLDVETMTLGVDPATGTVRWTVTGDRHGKARRFTAKPDGSKLERAG